MPCPHVRTFAMKVDDPAFVSEVRQHAATIRKAIVQINELSAVGDAQSFNQMTRWVNNKEEHASKIITACRYVYMHGV